MLWPKQKKIEYIDKEIEVEIGEQEYIVVLRNGEEHTIKCRGMAISKFISAGTIITENYIKANIRNAKYVMHIESFFNPQYGYVPIKLNDENEVIQAVIFDQLLKVKLGTYTPVTIKVKVKEPV